MIKARKKLKKAVIVATISGLAFGGAIANSVTTAEPAEAASGNPTWLEVFYSPNCQNASRLYSTKGTLTEAWIKDTFNLSYGWGSGGFGQPVRYNAASIKIPARTNAIIRSVNPVKNVHYTTVYDRTIHCFNLGDYGQRNKNIQFTLWAS